MQNSENSGILRDFLIRPKKHKNGKRLSVTFLRFFRLIEKDPKDRLSRVLQMPQVVTTSPEETLEYAKSFAQTLPVPSVICLFGNLGAGKTTFIKGLAEGLQSSAVVNSPTFQYLNIYPGKVPLYHFDLYRLTSADDFVQLGFDEFFGQGVVCIEWAEKIEALIPQGAIHVLLSHKGEARHIEIR